MYDHTSSSSEIRYSGRNMLSLFTFTLLFSLAFSAYNPRLKKYVPPVRPVPPPTVGECPGNRRLVPCILSLPQHECNSNRGCDAQHICCTNECGSRVCRLDPNIQILPIPSVGRCPNEAVGLNCLLSHARDQCTFNTDCRSGYCCENSCGTRVCRIKSIVPTPRLKACPVSRPRINCAVAFFTDECNNDGDCLGGTCCRNECNAKVCRSNVQGPIFPFPTIPSVDQCPADGLPKNDDCRIRLDECYDDNRCNSGEICCNNGCRNICRQPRFVPIRPKPGQCPVPRSTCLAGPRNSDECRNDQDCPGNLKCCVVVCDKVCTRPLGGGYGR